MPRIQSPDCAVEGLYSVPFLPFSTRPRIEGLFSLPFLPRSLPLGAHRKVVDGRLDRVSGLFSGAHGVHLKAEGLQRLEGHVRLHKDAKRKGKGSKR